MTDHRWTMSLGFGPATVEYIWDRHPELDRRSEYSGVLLDPHTGELSESTMDWEELKHFERAISHFRISQLQAEYADRRASSGTAGAKELVLELVERAAAGEYLGQFYLGQELSIHDVAEILEAPFGYIIDRIRELQAEDRLYPHSCTTLMKYPTPEEVLADWQAHTDHKLVTNAEDPLGWRCAACGRSSQDNLGFDEWICPGEVPGAESELDGALR